jgi:regulator of protease activity HflC (stomatin/prohibitin superfamily)
MLGFRHIKVDPTDFILQYKRGKVVREGAGLSFIWFAPTTSLAMVPIGSADVPFMFEEVTADFQTVTVQGRLTYRVAEPKQLARLMNYTLNTADLSYVSDDPQKLPQRLIDHAQVLTRASLNSLSLREALGQSDALVTSLRERMAKADVVSSLGVAVLGISILAVKPSPETARALEAEAREKMLREADGSVYARRNAAVEQERAIKENELNTEIALEESKKELVALSTANEREEADAKAYALAAVMTALSQVDPGTVQALASMGMDSGRLVALAFKELAEGADKIGQLNVSPDLLRELLAREDSQQS